MNVPPLFANREIIGLRIIPGWFGAYRVEIRRKRVLIRFTGPAEHTEQEVNPGPWRKMRPVDFPDVCKFL